MARKKIEDRNIRKMSKTTSGSYYVTLPVEFVRSLKWKDRQKLNFELDKGRGRIIIKDWEK
jgi:bifunctional DNA-binding transcriptional regulator/antitoxin component of YhaV-PrlF toxin-antitoxin module